MQNSEEDVDRVVGIAEERGLVQFQVGLIDSVGRVVGKRYHVSNLRKIMTEGLAIVSAASSGLDPNGGVIETNPFLDPSNGFADGLARCDASSYRDLPLVGQGDGLLILGQFVDEMAAICPRAQLAAELSRLEALGFSAYGAFEMECAPLAETPSTLATKAPNAVTVSAGFDRVYSFVHETMPDDLYTDLSVSCAAMDVGLDTVHSEFLNMVEVAMKPASGLRIADNAALYKAIAKIVGRRHDMFMSFMARRSDAEQGCGAHINVSLRDTTSEEGVFFDPAGEAQLSEVMSHFLGGLHRFTPELFLLLAPNLNSYKRFLPGLFTPLNNTWGVNNKTVAFRAVNRNAGAARVETRVSGADVNPHLALLAVLAAGRMGIEQQLVPPPPIEGDGWLLPDSDNGFPRTFPAAIDRFDTSTIAREVLGDRFVDVFVADRRWQQARFEQAVTDWELKMFADV
jgi:glutamine synthetase